MVDWNNSKYGIRLPGFQVFSRKTGKTVKVFATVEAAKNFIIRQIKRNENNVRHSIT